MSIDLSKQLSMIDTLIKSHDQEKSEKLLKYFLLQSETIPSIRALLKKFLDCRSQSNVHQQGEDLQNFASSLNSSSKNSELLFFSIYSFIGDHYRSLQDFLVSIRFYEKALNSIKSVPISEEFTLYCSVVECYYNLEEFSKVFNFFESIKNLSFDLTDTEKRSLVKVLNIVAFVYCRDAKWKFSIPLLERAKDLFETFEDNPDVKASGYNNLALCYFNIADFKNSLVYYEKTKGLYENLLNESDFLLVTINLNYSISLCEEKDFEKSLELLKECKKMIKKYHKDAAELARIYNYISICYSNQDLRYKAMMTLSKAFKLYQINNNFFIHETRFSLYLIGLFNLEEKMFDLSLSFLQKSSLLFDTYIKTVDIYSIRTSLNIGEVYLFQNKFDEALFLFENCLEVCKNEFSQNIHLMIEIKLYLGSALYLLGKRNEGYEIICSSYEMLLGLSDRVQIYFFELSERLFDLLGKEKQVLLKIADECCRIYEIFTKTKIKLKCEVFFNLLVILDWIWAERGNMDKCIEYLTTGAEFIISNSKYSEILGVLYEKLSLRYFYKNDFNKYLEYERLALRSTDDSERKLKILIATSTILHLVTDIDQVFMFISENLQDLKKTSTDCKKIISENIQIIGEKFEMQERLELSLSCFHISLDLINEDKFSSDLKKGKLNIALGNIYYKLNKLPESQQYFNIGSQILVKLSKDSFNIEFYVTIIKKLEQACRYSEAINWLNYTITLCKKYSPNSQDLHLLYLFLALCYEIVGNFQNSERTFMCCIDLIERQQIMISSKEKFDIYEHFAELYMKQMKFAEAFKMFKKSKKTYLMENLDQPRCMLMRKMIKCLIEMRRFEKALKEIEKLKSEIVKIFPPNHSEVFGIEFDLGDCLIGMKKIGEALVVLENIYKVASRFLPSSHPYLLYGKALIFKAYTFPRFL